MTAPTATKVCPGSGTVSSQRPGWWVWCVLCQHHVLTGEDGRLVEHNTEEE